LGDVVGGFVLWGRDVGKELSGLRRSAGDKSCCGSCVDGVVELR